MLAMITVVARVVSIFITERYIDPPVFFFAKNILMIKRALWVVYVEEAKLNQQEYFINQQTTK